VENVGEGFSANDVKHIRILSYGHNSQPVENHVNEAILGYRRRFLEMLASARRTTGVTKHMNEAHDMECDVQTQCSECSRATGLGTRA
jgi:hypothetical protein